MRLSDRSLSEVARLLFVAVLWCLSKRFRLRGHPAGAVWDWGLLVSFFLVFQCSLVFLRFFGCL